MNWELIGKFKKEAKETPVNADSNEEERLTAICKSRWLGKCHWCSKCELFPNECKEFAEKHGAQTIEEYIFKKETEKEKNGEI